MKSYEEITSEVLEAARERRQQMGKKRRITAIAITGGAVVGILALVIILRIPTQRTEVQHAVERQTVTTTVTETQAEIEATEAPAEVPTRAPRETRTTRSSTTPRTRYTQSVWEEDEPQQYQQYEPDDDLEDLDHPAAPTQYIEPSATDSGHAATTPAGVDPTEHAQTALPKPTNPPVVQTDPPIYIEPDPQPEPVQPDPVQPDPVQPDPAPVVPPADGGETAD